MENVVDFITISQFSSMFPVLHYHRIKLSPLVVNV